MNYSYLNYSQISFRLDGNILDCTAYAFIGFSYLLQGHLTKIAHVLRIRDLKLAFLIFYKETGKRMHTGYLS